jgi:hypothetical protein
MYIYTPLPTALSTPYNISDLFIGELGGRGGIVVTHMKNAITIYKRISLFWFNISPVDEN